MSELKPCPFCGGAAEYHDITYHSGRFGGPVYYREYYVGCTECDVETRINDSDKSKEGAALIWNSRAESTVTEETNRLLNLECKELKGDVDRLKLVLSLMLADYQCTASICGQEGYEHDYDKISAMAKELLDK